MYLNFFCIYYMNKSDKVDDIQIKDPLKDMAQSKQVGQHPHSLQAIV